MTTGTVSTAARVVTHVSYWTGRRIRGRSEQVRLNPTNPHDRNPEEIKSPQLSSEIGKPRMMCYQKYLLNLLLALGSIEISVFLLFWHASAHSLSYPIYFLVSYGTTQHGMSNSGPLLSNDNSSVSAVQHPLFLIQNKMQQLATCAYPSLCLSKPPSKKWTHRAGPNGQYLPLPLQANCKFSRL